MVLKLLQISCNRNIRTSSGTFLSAADDRQGVLRFIEEKIALLTGLPASHGEVCQSACRHYAFICTIFSFAWSFLFAMHTCSMLTRQACKPRLCTRLPVGKHDMGNILRRKSHLQMTSQKLTRICIEVACPTSPVPRQVTAQHADAVGKILEILPTAST